MKNLQIRPLAGLSFALLFVFNICLVITSVIKSDDLYVAYAILLSCAQFYLYERLKVSRVFFESNVREYIHNDQFEHANETRIKSYDINLN